jgi:hypothetical protein
MSWIIGAKCCNVAIGFISRGFGKVGGISTSCHFSSLFSYSLKSCISLYFGFFCCFFFFSRVVLWNARPAVLPVIVHESFCGASVGTLQNGSQMVAGCRRRLGYCCNGWALVLQRKSRVCFFALFILYLSSSVHSSTP